MLPDPAVWDISFPSPSSEHATCFMSSVRLRHELCSYLCVNWNPFAINHTPQHTHTHMHTSTFLPFSPFFFVFSPPPFNRPYSQSASGIVNFIFSCRNHFVLVAADEISCNTSSGKINKIWKWITAHPHFLDAPTRERAYPFFMHLDSECFYCSPLSCFRPLISRFDFAFFSFLIFILFFSLLNAHFYRVK